MHYFFLSIAALIGLVVGSFLNCLVWRIYKEETMMGRSYCPHCNHQLAWKDNIPLISFFWLRGSCRYCQQAISWQYPLVEFFTALLFLLAFIGRADSPDLPLLLARDWLLITTLLVVFVYDWRWQMVPMIVVWPMIIVAVGLNFLLGYSWQDLALFGTLGALFFLIQYLATARRGLGEGDVWLGLLLGVSLPQGGLLALSLALAYFAGALVSLVLLLSDQKGWKSKIALGPFLAFGAIITLIYGERIIGWYFGLF